MTAMSSALSARVCLVCLACLAGSLPLHAAETKGADSKAGNAKASNAKPADAKPADAKAVPAKAVEAPASASKEPEAKAAETKAAEAKPVEADAAAPAEIPVEVPANAYQLKEGDVLEVSVWREETLRKELRVLPDGGITFPLAGYVAVAGLTSGEVEKKIAQRLQAYLSDPVVTVVVGGINGNRAYVIGNVIKPGPIVLDAPTSVLQALSLAGGLGKFADEDAIKVLRARPDGQTTLPVRYKDLIKGKDLATNVQLKAGDTILVP